MQTNTHTLHLKAMAMPFTVKLVTASAHPLTATEVAAYRQTIGGTLTQIDRDFSPFRADSLVNRYQRHCLAAADFTADFQLVYGLAVQIQVATAGAFTPFFRGAYDPTGIVKGWAIQRVFTQYLRPDLDRHRLLAAAINGAGDIQTGVAPGQAFTWHVGVADPQDGHRVIARYPLQDGAIATSGTSQRGEHILRQTASALQQATVLAPDLLVADAYATAAIAMGSNRFVAFSRTHHLSGILVAPHRRTILEGGEVHVA